MVGRKGATTEKVPSKAALPSKQHDLFHFYQRQPRLRDEVKAASTSGIEAAALNSSSGSASQPPEVIDTNESFSENMKQSSMPETSDTIPRSIEHMGVLLDTLGPSPCMDPPFGRAGSGFGERGEPGKTWDSRNSTLRSSELHSAQSVIAIEADDSPTSHGVETHNAGSVNEHLQRTLYTEVASTSEVVEVPPATSRDVDDDSALAEQAPPSSNPYKTSSRKRLQKKKGGEVTTVPDVIDLTVFQEDSHAKARNSAASANQHHVYVVEDDDEGVTKNTPSGIQGAPIDLCSSPIESRPTRVIHPFFARHKEQKEKQAGIPSSTTHVTRHMQVPWPGAEDQHNTGPQTSFSSSSPSMFGKCRKTPAVVGSPIPSSLRWLNAEGVQLPLTDTYGTGVEPRTLTPLERETVISSLPSTHRQHPGISRILDGMHGSHAPCTVEDGGEIWSQRWRPRRAEQVLGNEDNALYLKAWLQALALRARDKPQMRPASKKNKIVAQDHNRRTTRPTVVRAVVKKRGRKRRRIESDHHSSIRKWIVDDDEATGSQSDSGDDDSVSSSSASGNSSLHGQHPEVVGGALSSTDDEIRFAEFSTLTNTILLAGPPGSGKSSTIYACAEELGWEVFEVYPGIGRRSGVSISSLIGDVSKNHLVGSRVAYNTDAKGVSNRPAFGYLAKERENEENTHLEDGEKVIRQSVILLDEVDVLFKEDANFWPTVVNIIRYSHRPVFMTCNDTSLIPQDDLPLQTCLHFKPCSSPLAVSFLQCVCLAEGHFVPQEQLEKVYAHTYPLISCDEPEIPPVPFRGQQPPCSDLRQTLNALQFWCSRDLPVGDTIGEKCDFSTIDPGITPHYCSEVLADWTLNPDGYCGDTPEASFDYDMVQIGKHADSTSYVDGYLERRPEDVLEALAIDSYEPSGDDELGHTLLQKPRVIGKSRGVYNRDADIARTALVVSRHVFETSGAGTRARGRLRGGERGSTRRIDCRSVVRARVETQALAVTFLDDVMTLSGPLLPRASVVLDYTPYVKHMVLADDVLEAETAATSGGDETRQRPGRRRWRMGEYQRHLSISAEGVEAARNMSLGWSV